MLKLVEVLIALALTYLLFSVFCSALVEGLAAHLKMRAAFLRDALMRMLGGEASAAQNADKLLGVKVPMSQLPADPLAVLAHPWIEGLSQNREEFPSYIDASRFGNAMLHRLLERFPIARAAAAGQDAAQESRQAYAALRQAVLADKSEVARLMAPLFVEFDSSIEELRKRMEAWFDQQMERASGWYRRWAQRNMLLIGFLVAVVFNVDSLAMFHAYWIDAELRETAVSAAVQVSDERKLTPEATKSLQAVQQKLLDSRLPVGWSLRGDLPDEFMGVVFRSLNPEWPEGTRTALAGLLKILGLLLTAVAVVPGAQVWFDTMVQLLNIRATGGKPAGKPAPAANPGAQANTP